MLESCFMGNLQVKNFPEDLQGELARRARSQGMSMSAYVTAELRRILARPTLDEWFDKRDQAFPPGSLPQIDAAAWVREARQGYDPDERALPE